MSFPADDYLSAPPVNATELQPSDLGCAQAKTRQQREDREIT
jgi:hypothetical protein